MKIIQINKSLPSLPKRVRVAAYARVSADYDATENSLSNQVSYYNKLIQSHSDWAFKGIFTDLGITGTRTDREGFSALMSIARRREIDLILTKSISRFARNTLDLLLVVRELKELDINVHFERENIDSISNDGELLLTMLASFAQEESRSISENVKWRIHKDFEKGISHTVRLYGYNRKGKEFSVNETEAAVVRMIFAEYLNGNSPDGIAKLLTEKGVKSPSGNDRFSYITVTRILRDISYTGDIILQKTFKENHLNQRKMVNKGELQRFYVEESIPAIISREIYEKTQKEIERRSALGFRANITLTFSPFTSKVICSHCGRSYRRRYGNRGNIYWKCSEKIEKGSSSCSSINIPEKVLIALTDEVLDGREFEDVIENIIVHDGRILLFVLKDGKLITKDWLVDSQNHSILNKEAVNA